MHGSTKTAKPSYQIISSSQRAEAAGHHQLLVWPSLRCSKNDESDSSHWYDTCKYEVLHSPQKLRTTIQRCTSCDSWGGLSGLLVLLPKGFR
jgi:hypothetical protein